ncbi:MAG: hypothetical protein AAGA76_16045 [Pseudomonadota bacterium]
MSTPKTYSAYQTMSPSDFYREVELGMRRAPEERARAVKEFWNWLTRR